MSECQFPEIEDIERSVFRELSFRDLFNAAQVSRRWLAQVWGSQMTIVVPEKFSGTWSLEHCTQLKRLVLPAKSRCKKMRGWEKAQQMFSLEMPGALELNTVVWPPRLKEVLIPGTDISAEDLKLLVQNCRQIERLDLSGCEIDDCISDICQLSMLRELRAPCQAPLLVGQIVQRTPITRFYTGLSAHQVHNLFADVEQLKYLMKIILPKQEPVAIYLKTDVEKVPFITPLLLAIKQSASDLVISLLIELGDDINARDVSGRTPFMTACKAGRQGLILRQRFQQIEDTDLHFVSNNGNNALSWAALRKNNQESIRELLQLGFDPNFSNKKKKTPLMLAADIEDAEMVQVLLDSNADPSLQDHNGQTALWYAANRGSRDIVAALIAHDRVGQFINLKSSFHDTTPLFEAVWRNFTEVARLLILCPSANVTEPRKSKDGRLHTPLLQALHNQNDTLALLLMDHPDVNINSSNANRSSPLAVAATVQNDAMVKSLLDKGADPESPSHHHPLLVACSKPPGTRSFESVKALLKWYSDRWDVPQADGKLRFGVELFNPLRDVVSPKEGWTPLHWASIASAQNLEQLLRFPGSKSCINVRDNNDGTPLFRALEQKGPEQNILPNALMLLQAGADPNIPAKVNKETHPALNPLVHTSPLALVRRMDRPELALLLVSYGATLQQSER